MTDKQYQGKPEAYWDRAGEVSYAQAMFTSGLVEEHVNRRLWAVAVEIADALGVPRNGRVLDLGCGDGAFANHALAARYREIVGYDLAPAAIERAKARAPGPHLHFAAADLVTFDYGSLQHFDGAFLIGILHHVKADAPTIVAKLRALTQRVVVLEPNGDNLVRKLLEFTPSYRSAGEDSFHSKQVTEMFARAGFCQAVWRRLNLFPNFTPAAVYRLLAPLEPRIEASSFWNALCTVNMYGFTAAS
jgi:SAM-dependent methyltransferase